MCCYNWNELRNLVCFWSAASHSECYWATALTSTLPVDYGKLQCLCSKKRLTASHSRSNNTMVSVGSRTKKKDGGKSWTDIWCSTGYWVRNWEMVFHIFRFCNLEVNVILPVWLFWAVPINLCMMNLQICEPTESVTKWIWTIKHLDHTADDLLCDKRKSTCINDNVCFRIPKISDLGDLMTKEKWLWTLWRQAAGLLGYCTTKQIHIFT